MPDPIQALGERYRLLSDEELLFIASDGGLTEEAKVVLGRELAWRGIRNVDVQAYKEALDRDEALRTEELKRKLERTEKFHRVYTLVGVATLVLLFLTGAYQFFVKGDDNGLVVMISVCVLALPLLLIMRSLSRFVWRILLRP